MQTETSIVPRYAVFGHPIAHSLSPRIHMHFGAQTGVVLTYERIDAPPGQFAESLSNFANHGGRGANITLPHKRAAMTHCAALSEFAERVEAVNTLSLRPDGQWNGDNTDGPGLVRDLTHRHAMDLRGRRTLLLGAGGAASATAFALLDAGVDELMIVNRSPERADELADSIGDPQRAHTRYWDDLPNCGSFDLIVNATSVGHSDSTLSLPFGLANTRTLCYDLSYGAAAFVFLAWARAANCAHALDGLGMLVEQAAESFAIWCGARPETDAIYAELRTEMPLHATD